MIQKEEGIVNGKGFMFRFYILLRMLLKSDDAFNRLHTIQLIEDEVSKFMKYVNKLETGLEAIKNSGVEIL